MAIAYCTTGKAEIVKRIIGSSTATVYYIGWGTGGSGTLATATVGDTLLFAEATEARVLATLSATTVDTAQFVATITNQKAGGKTIEEGGVFGATSTATAPLIIHTTFGDITTATGDSIQFTFTLQQT